MASDEDAGDEVDGREERAQDHEQHEREADGEEGLNRQREEREQRIGALSGDRRAAAEWVESQHEDHESHEQRESARDSAREVLEGEDGIERDRMPSTDGTTGALQRLRFHVPTADTTLLLGHKSTDVGYSNGITGITDGHVFLSSNHETLSMQAEKQVLLQSTTSKMFAFSTDDALLGSAKTAYISGKSGVMISSGTGPSPEALARTGASPMEQMHFVLDQAKEDAESASKTVEHVASALGIAAAAIGGLASAGDIVAGVGSIAATAAVLADAGSTNSIIAHGGEALFVATKGAMLAGGDSATIAGGIQAEMVAGVKVEVGALGVASLVGLGKAAVEAIGKAEVLSAVKTEIASRRGLVEIAAPHIEVGGMAAHLTQAPTIDVEILALNEVKVLSTNEIVQGASTEIKLVAGEVTPPPPGPGGKAVQVGNDALLELNATEKKAEIKAGQKIVLEVGHWVVTIDGENNIITVGKHSGSGPKMTINEDDIWIGHNNGEMIGLNKSSGITMMSKSNTMQFESSGVKINGSSIKLG